MTDDDFEEAERAAARLSRWTEIEFDPSKREEVLRTRGLGMARTEEVFAGATKTVEDRRKYYGETRYITVGFLDERMVIVVWTDRHGVHRVISMRKANEREQARYGPEFRR